MGLASCYRTMDLEKYIAESKVYVYLFEFFVPYRSKPSKHKINIVISSGTSHQLKKSLNKVK